MKITSQSVTYGRKWNLDNYESATVEVTMWASLDEDDDPQQTLDMLWDMARASVRAHSIPLLEARERQRAKLRAAAEAAVERYSTMTGETE